MCQKKARDLELVFHYQKIELLDSLKLARMRATFVTHLQNMASMSPSRCLPVPYLRTCANVFTYRVTHTAGCGVHTRCTVPNAAVDRRHMALLPRLELEVE